ncbi:MAG: hypothetical protein A2287_04885 [Candidatus Melainabacteria bacterium RIFOXYA12_FULL_32_12]|nr:MAG: hypothetical protein A2255_03485 [Candidatus Melainabacteria bacterium RIFOXYA2_FULL_32_9]OGI28580.1 MAG: hypothetical protein A2287_04885 [Candidatus Melainabacteria bacterium RIFOXYA12_FULL_32_12]
MNTKIENKFVYYLNDSMYINVTNLCTNNCVFCIRSLSDTVAGANLKLESESISSYEIIEEIKNSSISVPEIVFCGYGEPLIKLDIVKDVAKFIKQNYPEIPVRINTNGHANLIHKRNIIPELVGIIDKISVSLNADNAEFYQELTGCKLESQIAYEGVKNFIAECVNQGIDTTATVVQGFGNYDINVEKCRKITEELGATFKIREWLDEGYK